MNSDVSAWWLLAGLCLGVLATGVASYIIVRLKDQVSEEKLTAAKRESFDQGWETALSEVEVRQVIFPRSSRGLWKKAFLVVQERVYFKHLPISSFSEHVIEVSRELDLQNIESLVKIVANILGSPDLRQLIGAGLKMTIQTRVLDQKGQQIGTWSSEPKQS